MVDLRVIEGGGGDGGDGQARLAEEKAAWAVEKLAIEMLRGVARGGESAYPVGSVLQELFAHLATDGVRVFQVMDAGLRAVNDRLIPDGDPYDEDLRWLLRAAVRLTAEKVATDGFAKGRASQRERDLRDALDRYLLHKEEQSRKYRGSYLTSLLQRLPPLQSKPHTPLPTRRSKPKKKPKL